MFWVIGGLFLAGLAVSSTLLYLRWVGVPDFAKDRIVQALRQRGIVAGFDRLHLRGLTLEAENVQLAPLDPGANWKGAAGRAVARFDRETLRTGGLLPKTVAIERAHFAWHPSPPTNSSAPKLVIGDAALELRLLQRDHWELTRLDARLFNLRVHATASVTNASAARAWAIRPRKDEPSARRPRRLNELLARLADLRLSPESKLDLRLTGDGRDPGSFHAQLDLQIPEAAWRGSTLESAHVEAGAAPNPDVPGTLRAWLNAHAGSGSAARSRFQGASLVSRGTGSLADRSVHGMRWDLRLPHLALPFAAVDQLSAAGSTIPLAGNPGQALTELVVNAGAIRSSHGQAHRAQLRAEVQHAQSPSNAWQAHWQLGVPTLQTPQGELSGVEFSGNLRPGFPFARWQPVDETWSFLSPAEPFELDWQGSVQSLKSPRLQAEALAVAGWWRAPELGLERLSASLYDGQLQASAWVNAATRELTSDAWLDFDVHRISPLLTPLSRKWLSQFAWQTPPSVSARARMRLPAWTGAGPRWREEVMPTIELDGEFAGTAGSFRDVPVSYAKSHFTLSNLTWRLPDLFVQRANDKAMLGYEGHMGTHAYHWRVNAAVNPSALKPLLTEPGARRAVDQFAFTDPPSFQGEVWGHWRDRDSVRFTGAVRAANFIFRGERCDQLTGFLSLSNALLRFADVTVKRGVEHISVTSGAYDITNRVVNLTNALSTMNPDLVTRVIGPKVHAAFLPYHFPSPPTVRVNGRVPVARTEDADVRFEVAGEAFRYWKLHAERIRGDVRWRGDTVSITNLQSDFCGGELRWHGDFDFSRKRGAQFSFEGKFRQADLHCLMEDLGKKTNNLQGFLDADFTITHADSRDWRSWDGFGRVRLRDGFLWDIPIFGFFSPVLNSVVPGLGNSPISAGDATFTIKRSVLRSSDLELMSPALRLAYTGSVDFEGNLDARMQAEILRDAWGVGKAVSLALWPISKVFEYRLTGNVAQPETEPVYLPKFLLWPLNPFRSIQRLFSPPQPRPAPPTGAGLFGE